ncbi:unnamed protein product, partial [Mesorhabditis spiculigera]
MYKVLALVAVFGCAVLAQGQGEQEPPFLTGIPAALKQEFITIQNNGQLSDNQADAQTKAWAKKLPAAQKKQFDDIESKGAAAEKEGRAKQAAAIAKLSAAAKGFDAKLQAIADNKDLPRAKKGEQMEALQKSIPANVGAELQGVFQQLQG